MNGDLLAQLTLLFLLPATRRTSGRRFLRRRCVGRALRSRAPRNGCRCHRRPSCSGSSRRFRDGFLRWSRRKLEGFMRVKGRRTHGVEEQHVVLLPLRIGGTRGEPTLRREILGYFCGRHGLTLGSGTLLARRGGSRGRFHDRPHKACAGRVRGPMRAQGVEGFLERMQRGELDRR